MGGRHPLSLEDFLPNHCFIRHDPVKQLVWLFLFCALCSPMLGTWLWPKCLSTKIGPNRRILAKNIFFTYIGNLTFAFVAPCVTIIFAFGPITISLSFPSWSCWGAGECFYFWKSLPTFFSMWLLYKCIDFLTKICIHLSFDNMFRRLAPLRMVV